MALEDDYVTSPHHTEVRAREHTKINPQPVCDDFTAQDGQVNWFWCRNCSWNKSLHEDDLFRVAVLEQLEKMQDE